MLVSTVHLESSFGFIISVSVLNLELYMVSSRWGEVGVMAGIDSIVFHIRGSLGGRAEVGGSVNISHR